MIKDCIDIFEKVLNEKGDEWLLDTYIPKEGTYILINMDKNFEIVGNGKIDISYDKKNNVVIGATETLYPYIRTLDYYSKLLEMNKPIDPKKVIHANNMYSFFVKKESILEGKLTKEIVKGYYDVLSNLEKKYSKPNAKEIYKSVEEELGAVDIGEINKIEEWINEVLVDMSVLDTDMNEKGYLKLFFVYDDSEKTIQKYKNENKRYLIPNIYNSNDYNKKIEESIYGLSNNNMGLNSKKPFLENKTRPIKTPYMIDLKQAELQTKFFDYLWGTVSRGNYNIYMDYDTKSIIEYADKDKRDVKIDSGLYLRIRKDKNEVAIVDCDTITDYNPNLKNVFYYKQMLEIRESKTEILYGVHNKLYEVAAVVDDVFFGKRLAYNYYTAPEDINIQDTILENLILTYRDTFYAWLYKGQEYSVQNIIDEISDKIIANSVNNGYFSKAVHQINLSWSLNDYFNKNNEKEELVKMVQSEFKKHIDNYDEDWKFIGDEEYCYAVGQMIGYLISLSKGAKTPMSLINPFLSMDNDELVKEKLIDLFEKYNYAMDIKKDVRVKNIISHIMLYEVQDKIHNRYIVAGLTAKNSFYSKKDVNKEGGNENE